MTTLKYTDEQHESLSGFVILHMSRELPPGDGCDLREHAEQLQLEALCGYLDALDGPDTRRLITSLDPSELLRMEEQAMDSPCPPSTASPATGAWTRAD